VASIRLGPWGAWTRPCARGPLDFFSGVEEGMRRCRLPFLASMQSLRCHTLSIGLIKVFAQLLTMRVCVCDESDPGAHAAK